MARLKKICGDDVVQIKTPYGLLANNIIIQAISDWENMVTGVLHETAKINFGELRVFFRGGFCDVLLAGTGLTGEYILDALEDMKKAKEYGMSPATWRKRRSGRDQVKEKRCGRLHSFR